MPGEAMSSYQTALGEHQDTDTVEGIPAEEHEQAQHSTTNGEVLLETLSPS